jgi:hypothetical protein
MGEVAELLRREGCTSASIFFDGGELVIVGCAPSYEAKRRLQTLVAELIGYPVRNSMRVFPS